MKERRTVGPIGMLIICWKILPKHSTNMLSIRNSRIRVPLYNHMNVKISKYTVIDRNCTFKNLSFWLVDINLIKCNIYRSNLKNGRYDGFNFTLLHTILSTPSMGPFCKIVSEKFVHKELLPQKYPKLIQKILYNFYNKKLPYNLINITSICISTTAVTCTIFNLLECMAFKIAYFYVWHKNPSKFSLCLVNHSHIYIYTYEYNLLNNKKKLMKYFYWFYFKLMLGA